MKRKPYKPLFDEGATFTPTSDDTMFFSATGRINRMLFQQAIEELTAYANKMRFQVVPRKNGIIVNDPEENMESFVFTQAGLRNMEFVKIFDFNSKAKKFMNGVSRILRQIFGKGIRVSAG
jgi:hypothetical protein